MRDTLFPILVCIVFAVIFFTIGQWTAMQNAVVPFPDRAPAIRYMPDK